MKFTPFEKFIIKSNINVLELSSYLLNKTEPKKHFRIKRNNKKPYEGKIEKNSFKINRIINYRNPFLPIIKGQFITQNNKGTNIKISMRVKPFVLLFMIFWSFSPILFFIKFPPKSIILPIIISIICVIIGYLFLFLPFNYERNKSKIFLIELFSSERIDEKS